MIPAHEVPGVDTMGFQRILVGVDGSAASLDALSWAAPVADAAEVVAGPRVHAAEGRDSQRRVHRLRSEAEKLLITLSAKVRTAVPVSSLVVDGEPDELLGLAAKERA